MKDAESASDAGKTSDKKSSSSSTSSGFTLGRPRPGLECIPEADVSLTPGQYPESEMHFVAMQIRCNWSQSVVIIAFFLVY